MFKLILVSIMMVIGCNTGPDNSRSSNTTDKDPEKEIREIVETIDRYKWEDLPERFIIEEDVEFHFYKLRVLRTKDLQEETHRFSEINMLKYIKVDGRTESIEKERVQNSLPSGVVAVEVILHKQYRK